jgi:hypothetical protein
MRCSWHCGTHSSHPTLTAATGQGEYPLHAERVSTTTTLARATVATVLRVVPPLNGRVNGPEWHPLLVRPHVHSAPRQRESLEVLI